MNPIIGCLPHWLMLNIPICIYSLSLVVFRVFGFFWYFVSWFQFCSLHKRLHLNTLLFGYGCIALKNNSKVCVTCINGKCMVGFQLSYGMCYALFKAIRFCFMRLLFFFSLSISQSIFEKWSIVMSDWENDLSILQIIWRLMS